MESQLPTPDDVFKVSIALALGAGTPSGARSYGEVFGRALVSQILASRLFTGDSTTVMTMIDLNLTLAQVRDSENDLMAEFGDGALQALRKRVDRAAWRPPPSARVAEVNRALIDQEARLMLAAERALGVETAHIRAENRYTHARQMAQSQAALERSRALLARLDRDLFSFDAA